jgi:hypothetical protein
MRLLQRLIEAFDWKIFDLDLRSLALFRIGLAILLFIDLRTRTRDLRAHYTDEGAVPRHAIQFLPEHSFGPLSLHRLTGTERGQKGLFALHFVAVAALLCGFRTRTATIVSWIMLISLQNRNPLVMQADDVIRRLLLYWALYLPLGARYSIDQMLQPSMGMPVRIRSMGTASLMLQVCLIYWFTGMLKDHPVWRKEGTAIYYTLRLDHITTPSGRLLLRHPRLMKRLTLLVVPFEIIVPFLLFVPQAYVPFRVLAFSAVALFHLALGRSLMLGIFSETCIVAWLPFLPGALWDRLGAPGVRGNLGSASACSDTSQGPYKDLAIGAQALAAASLALVVLWNLNTLKWATQYPIVGELVRRLKLVYMLLRLDQRWAMFAPQPQRNDGWYVIRGVQKDGREVDLLRHPLPVQWEQPEGLSSSFGNVRWRQFMQSIALSPSGNIRIYYAAYLRREWNRTRPEPEHLQSLKMYYMVEETLLEMQVSDPIKLLLWDHDKLRPLQPTSIGADLPADELRKLLGPEGSPGAEGG